MEDVARFDCWFFVFVGVFCFCFVYCLLHSSCCTALWADGKTLMSDGSRDAGRPASPCPVQTQKLIIVFLSVVCCALAGRACCIREPLVPVRVKSASAFPRAPGMGGRGDLVGNLLSVTTVGHRCEFKECCTNPGLLDPVLHESAGIGWIKPQLPLAPPLPQIRHAGGS